MKRSRVPGWAWLVLLLLLGAAAALWFAGRPRPPFGAIAPMGMVLQEPSEFHWQPHPAAHRYRFELRDETGALRFGTFTSKSFCEVPEKARVVRGYWQVVALATDGAELLSTPRVVFETKP